MIMPQVILQLRYRLVGWEFRNDDQKKKAHPEVIHHIKYLYSRLKMIEALLLRAWWGSKFEFQLRCKNGPRTINDFVRWYV